MKTWSSHEQDFSFKKKSGVSNMLSSIFPIIFNEHIKTFLSLKIFFCFSLLESFWQEIIVSSSIKAQYQASIKVLVWNLKQFNCLVTPLFHYHGEFSLPGEIKLMNTIKLITLLNLSPACFNFRTHLLAGMEITSGPRLNEKAKVVLSCKPSAVPLGVVGLGVQNLSKNEPQSPLGQPHVLFQAAEPAPESQQGLVGGSTQICPRTASCPWCLWKALGETLY